MQNSIENKPEVLIVTADTSLRKYLINHTEGLPARGFRVIHETDQAEIFDYLATRSPRSRIVIFEPIGFEFGVRDIRKASPYIGLVAIGQDDTPKSAVSALEEGADHYQPKSFPLEVLAAHMNSILSIRSKRSTDLDEERILTAGDFQVDPDSGITKRNGQLVPMSKTACKFVSVLAGQHDRVMSHREIVAGVASTYEGDDVRITRVWVSRVRKYLGETDRPKVIITNPKGYMFSTKVLGA